MGGVTIHKQLANENHPYPRKRKLAVKLDRSEPSSKMQKGKWYAHVHQIKIYNPKFGTRWLGTSRLIRKLKQKFGSRYFPKQNYAIYSRPMKGSYIPRNSAAPHFSYQVANSNNRRTNMSNRLLENQGHQQAKVPVYYNQHFNNPHPTQFLPEHNQNFFQRSVVHGMG